MINSPEFPGPSKEMSIPRFCDWRCHFSSTKHLLELRVRVQSEWSILNLLGLATLSSNLEQKIFAQGLAKPDQNIFALHSKNPYFEN